MAPRSSFVTITTEGGLLSADLLDRLARQPATVSGTSPKDYHLPPGRRVRDAINRSWTELQGAWSTFEKERQRLSVAEQTTTITRERWLLPLFAELGFGRLQKSPTLSVQGRDYPISHLWGAIPIHLLGANVELDRRTKGVAGAASAAPFSMVQEFLNRSDGHLWGIVSNGRRLRLLRDNTSLTRVAYVDFDLEAMFSGQVFGDFAVLWMVCHESRFEAERPEGCWLERWLEEARQQGVRALDSLRRGFEQAIVALGSGFLSHRANTDLRDKLRRGELSVEDYQRQLLRLVYRIVFLLVAEDRDLLHPRDTSERARQLYGQYYSVGRIRDLARRHRGGRHVDLYASLRPVFAALGADGIPALGVPALGSFLWSKEACPDLEGAEISNADLLAAIRHLAYTEVDRSLQRVDFANLGSEELGSVYESLLELHPRIEADAARFELASVAGSERKSTGSYYTPTSLVSVLLDQALEPVLEQAAASSEPKEAILSLKVLDPACGSGHFLTAAARRIATRLAEVETGELNPPLEAVRHALREVVGRCIYGIDLNPMAVELAKVNLWLEAVEPGHPLSFLDHHLLCGNALIGATPRLIAEGIPDEAFKPIEGDDKHTALVRKRKNAAERKQHNQGKLPFRDLVLEAVERLGKEAKELDVQSDTTTEALRDKEAHWATLQVSEEAKLAKLVADTWCAAFFAPKVPDSLAITHSTLRAVAEGHICGPESVGFVASLAERYRFLHPHVAFPDVFTPDPQAERGWVGGFDVVIGNPPWERVEFREREFFATRSSDIAEAAGARRKKLISALQVNDPLLHCEYQEALRASEVEAHFLRNSGRYPLCGQGRLNTYAVFAELMRSMVAPTGRVGVILPTGIATDDTTKAFFQQVSAGELVSLYDFENKGVFPAVDSRYKFCLLTLAGQVQLGTRAELCFFCHAVEDLLDPTRRFKLSPEEIALLNPNTRTCPIFRSRRDAEITLGIYQRVPVLFHEGDPECNPWKLRFRQGLFNMTSHSSLFHTREQLEAQGFALEGNIFRRGEEVYLPLYEAKMVHHFDHRWASYTGDRLSELSARNKTDPEARALPRYWVAAKDVADRLGGWERPWLLGFRDIANVTNERTVIAAVIPRCGAGNNFTLLISECDPGLMALLGASLASIALDFVARQKVGGTNLNFFLVEQLPVPPPEVYGKPAPWDARLSLADWLIPRVLELTYTASDLDGFAHDLGYEGPPFCFDEGRRMQLRAELDACFFHLYGIERKDVDYILDTFPILARREEATCGEFRTKRLVLDCYDAMTKAVATGIPYQAPFDLFVRHLKVPRR